MKVCIISSYPPEQCGIAKYSHHLRTGMLSSGITDVLIIAMVKAYGIYDPEVIHQIKYDEQNDYAKAAEVINMSDIDAVFLQHEFSFFSGNLGSDVLSLLRNITKPVITTLHTLRSNGIGMDVVQEICKLSKSIICISDNSKEMLLNTYNIHKENVTVIPNGVPCISTDSQEELKKELQLSGHAVAFSFGFVNPNKGYESVLQILPWIIKKHPSFLYLIIGKTHPTTLATAGENYRNYLKSIVARTGISPHVRFIDQYLSDEDLIKYIVASDIFIAPYHDGEQNSSYTLSHAAFYGKACITTPFLGAIELLADGSGCLIPHENSALLLSTLEYLVNHPHSVKEMGKSAREKAKEYSWPAVAEKYLRLLTS